MEINQLKREVDHYKGIFDTSTREMETNKRQLIILERRISDAKRDLTHYERELETAERQEKAKLLDKK